MKICFIGSTAQRCGIARYTRNYVKALSRLSDVLVLDAGETAANPRSARRANEFDVVHIQYETSHFFSKNSDRYQKICREIKKPIIVTLHEVYRVPPDVFPRERITGRTRLLRKVWYDLRHPYQTALRRHAKHGFFAKCIHVHYPYQVEILRSLCPSTAETFVLPHPVPRIWRTKCKTNRSAADSPKRLGATGFVGLGYGYDLLMQTLDRIAFPWHFTWIGGPRTADGQRVLERLQSEINARRWEDNFRITGWVSEEDLICEMNQLDFYLAFFRTKSTSGSLCTALGTHLPVLTTCSELASDINVESSALAEAAPTPDELSMRLHELVRSRTKAKKMRQNAALYSNRRSLENTAQLLYKQYQDLQSDHSQTIRK